MVRTERYSVVGGWYGTILGGGRLVRNDILGGTVVAGRFPRARRFFFKSQQSVQKSVKTMIALLKPWCMSDWRLLQFRSYI